LCDTLLLVSVLFRVGLLDKKQTKQVQENKTDFNIAFYQGHPYHLLRLTNEVCILRHFGKERKKKQLKVPCSELENLLYHERQTGTLCGLHALNNLVINSDMPKFITKELDDAASELADQSDKSDLSDFGSGGNWNIDVLEKVLLSRGHKVTRASTKRQIDQVVQLFHPDLPYPKLLIGLLLGDGTHYTCFIRQDSRIFLFDSLNVTPILIDHLSLIEKISESDEEDNLVNIVLVVERTMEDESDSLCSSPSEAQESDVSEEPDN